MIVIIRDADGQHWVDGKEFKPQDVQLYHKKTLTRAVRMTEPFIVDTLEGEMEGKPGDMLMIGINGKMYPCDADIFEKTYTLAEGHSVTQTVGTVEAGASVVGMSIGSIGS